MFNRTGFQRLIPYAKLPQNLLIAGFTGMILVGTLLLLLPWSQTRGDIGLVDALFTATSAVCVTGLIVVDTATAYSRFGQVVILALIQVGGLGIMTFAALAYLMLGRRLSLASQAALHDAFFQRDLGIEFKKRFRQILAITAVIELAGMAFICLGLLWLQTPLKEALFSSVFHAISAFCNAGFSIYTDNLMRLRGSPVILVAVMLLIVLGGLGHMVLTELWHAMRARLDRTGAKPVPSRLSVHARVVLQVTGLLILGGWLGLLILGLTAGEPGWDRKILDALFQSITARTAGFNTVNIGLLPLGSLWLLTILMFIGGSPGSCAGGVKTTALAISLAELKAKLFGDEQVTLKERRVPKPIVWRTLVLLRLALAWNAAGILLLLFTEAGRPGVGLHDVIFEQISAFGTVGLSTGLTDKLSTWGRLWIIATMFVGRLGPLTIALGLAPVKPLHVAYPEGKVMIG
ncbi:MAG: potassium transporter TrkG [Deltaproteobacteria bacterium]|nr:potassium transporter TrkG [Deltaproteobacteria bacterium]